MRTKSIEFFIKNYENNLRNSKWNRLVGFAWTREIEKERVAQESREVFQDQHKLEGERTSKTFSSIYLKIKSQARKYTVPASRKKMHTSMSQEKKDQSYLYAYCTGSVKSSRNPNMFHSRTRENESFLTFSLTHCAMTWFATTITVGPATNQRV